MTLQASGLAFERGQRRLFSHIGFDVAPGQALRVRGRNGSGKTSLLRVLCGLAQPLAGEVYWRGKPIASQREAFHQNLLYIGHGHGLKDELSAWENLQISTILSGHACTRAQAINALDQVGLVNKVQLPARVLSQGQRRRVLLARLALAPPAMLRTKLLVLDEPFVALDQESVSALSSLLASHLACGAMLVYTTHQPQAIQASRTHEVLLDGVAIEEAA